MKTNLFLKAKHETEKWVAKYEAERQYTRHLEDTIDHYRKTIDSLMDQVMKECDRNRELLKEQRDKEQGRLE